MKLKTIIKFITVFFISLSIGFLGTKSKPAYAASEDACAIWICLPGGFPSGCGDAYSEFKRRIKKRKSPLPSLSSCSTGPDGKGVNGRYELGYERYEECNEGYVLREIGIRVGSGNRNEGLCYLETCAPPEGSNNENRQCESYDAILRTKPSYVKMWVEGDYLGQFFY